MYKEDVFYGQCSITRLFLIWMYQEIRNIAWNGLSIGMPPIHLHQGPVLSNSYCRLSVDKTTKDPDVQVNGMPSPPTRENYKVIAFRRLSRVGGYYRHAIVEGLVALHVLSWTLLSPHVKHVASWRGRQVSREDLACDSKSKDSWLTGITSQDKK